MKILFAIITLAFATSPARAANPFYCVPIAEIDPHISYCPDNRHFVDAAGLCLQKLQNDVQRHQQLLAGAFRANAAASASAQHLKQKNSNQDLTGTDQSLRDLLARAAAARAELAAYVKAIILPGAPPPGVAEDPVIFAIMSRSFCYYDARVKLEAMISELDQKIAELRRADTATLALHTTTRGHLSNLGTLNAPTPSAARTAAAGAPSRAGVPAGVARNPASTITGKIRNERLP